jgi:hypothetical protein
MFTVQTMGGETLVDDGTEIEALREVSTHPNPASLTVSVEVSKEVGGEDFLSEYDVGEALNEIRGLVEGEEEGVDWERRVDEEERENETVRERKLEAALAWATECELATLERYEGLKSSSQSETERHREICNQLVETCVRLGVRPEDSRGSACPRLKKEIESLTREEP